MSDIEIGRAKRARRAYNFEDIAIVPTRRTRDPHDVSVNWTIDAYQFDIPVLAAPMDSVVSPATAIAMGKLGGVGVLNLEGVWTRYEDPEKVLAEIRSLPAEKAVARMQQIAPKPLDIHLMIANVDNWAGGYAETGAYSVTFHAEASENPVALARKLRAIGARAGVAIKPGTDVEPFLEVLHEFDQLLVMTVEPGFGGQSLIEDTLAKVSKARRKIDAEKLDIWLQVDGGIDESNIERVASLGADTFVAGSAVFKADDRAKQIDHLRDLANSGIAHRH